MKGSCRSAPPPQPHPPPPPPLQPSPPPPIPELGCMCWPTGTLTPLPGVTNSSQPTSTISGRCHESKMMNYEYPGDVDRISALRENGPLFFPLCHFGQPNKQTESVGGGLISTRPFKWGPTEIGCFSEVFKDFMSWRGCLAEWWTCLSVIALMTSSSPSCGWSTQGPRQLGTMSRRGQHEPLTAQHLHGYMITAEMEEVVGWGQGEVGGWQQQLQRKGQEITEQLFLLPLSLFHSHAPEAQEGSFYESWYLGNEYKKLTSPHVSAFVCLVERANIHPS